MSALPLALDHPLAAAAGVAAAVVTTAWLARGSRAEGSAARLRRAAVLRCALLALLVLALAGLQWRTESDVVTTVFVVDSSDSTRGVPRERARRWVEEAARHLSADDRLAVVQFGRDALVEEAPRPDLPELALASTPRPDGSDLTAALHLARGLLPATGLRRVILLTDGAVDGEDPAGAVRRARDAGIDVGVVPLRRDAEGEVLVEEVVAPARAHEGEPFEVRVVLRASAPARGRLTVTRNGEVVGQQDLEVAPGPPTVVRLTDRLAEAGSLLYRAHFDGEPDGYAQNDAAEALVRVDGQPSVLIVDPDRRHVASFAALLEATGLSVRVAGPEALPTDLAEASRYEVVIVSDLAALELSLRQMKVLRAAVRETGAGLLMAGGPDSFGPGGWYSTPVEEALPVDSDVRNEKYYPSLFLVTALDKSGSMAGEAGASKMDLAKQAAVMAVELLHPDDRAAVLAFDSAAKEVVRPAPLVDRESIIDAIGTIRAGGGTDIYTALVQAAEYFEGERTVLKHLIVLSDGRSPPRDYAGIIGRITDAGGTLSTVAAGADADVFTMERLARLGGGRYYYTDDPLSIPRIFTKEAFTTARSYLVEEPFQPVVSRSHPVLAGIDGTAALAGYVATTAKPGAEVLLETHRGDPLLAVHRFGLGRTAAFTSDLGARWAPSWLGDQQSRALFAQLVRWLARKTESSRLRVSIDRADGRLVVRTEARDDADGYLNFAHLEASVVGPDLETRTLPLEQVAPGRYETSVPAEREGAWFVAVAQRSGDRLTRAATASSVVPYSDEYRVLDAAGAPERLIASSGARLVTDPRRAFDHVGVRAVALRPAWREATLLACLLLLVDVAVRRVMLPEGWADALRARMRPGRGTAHDAAAGLSRLRQAKERTRRRLDPTPVAGPAPARERGRGTPPPAARPAPPAPAPTASPASGETGQRPPERPAQGRPADEDAPSGSGGFAGRLLAAKRRARTDRDERR